MEISENQYNCGIGMNRSLRFAGVGAHAPSNKNIRGLHHAMSGPCEAESDRNQLVTAIIAALRDASQDEVVQELVIKLSAHDSNVAPQAKTTMHSMKRNALYDALLSSTKMYNVADSFLSGYSHHI